MNTSQEKDTLTTHQVLHPHTCKQTPEDLSRMSDILTQDPDSIYRQRHPIQGHILSGAMTPLLSAVYHHHSKCVQFLLENGSQANFYDTGCYSTPLYFAMFLLFRDDEEESKIELETIIEILIKNGASPYIPNVRILINQETKDITKSFYIETVVKNGSLKLLKLLLEHGCIVQDLKINSLRLFECRSGKGVPIINSIRLKNIDAFKLLLLYGASIDFYYDMSNQPFSCPLVILHVFKNEIESNDITECLKYMKSYRMHGGTMYSKSDVPNILEVLQKKSWLKNRNIDFEDEIENLMQNPLSLKCMCRVHLKQQFGTQYVQKVKLLPWLPKEVVHFLNFSDL